ncbi:MAG TPA: polysaccharide lyase family protein [Verrucomicrobiae bacterium]|nr:polysaccharide lyase family protein [Verrucomicrobiae bacterium]
MTKYFAGIALVALCGIGFPLANAEQASPVVLTETETNYTLANGIVTARISKHSGDLVSLRYHNLELLGAGSGHPYGYWSHSPGRGMREADSITINPAANHGERAEVSIKGFYNGGFRSGAAGPGGGTACDIEIRYTLGRGEAGVYTYSIFTHATNYPATGIGEARFGVKLNADVFDYMTIDKNRSRLMPKPEDWDNGTELNFKEARRLNTGIYKGQVEHKYDYSAIQFDIPAFGWSSTKDHVGLWFVNPSTEYLSGGATKVELTGHLDNNEGAAPTLLNYWRGSHYGGSVCAIGEGEAWNKVIGPFLIYCNSGKSPDAMWKNALARAKKESAAWPYDWVRGVDYPHKNERGSAKGRIVLNDIAGIKMSHLLVGLSAPDYMPPQRNSFGRRGFYREPQMVNWQNDAKFYEFWTRGDNRGNFAIPEIRPGTYTLHAIADGVLGEFEKTNITIRSGETLDLGRLEWKPERFGRQLWEIGIPNRSAEEFRHGDHYWQWGLYNDYAKEFPNDVNFVIGRSDIRKDWNYAQVPRGYGTGTTWSVYFKLPDAPRGTATLRLGIAAASVRRGVRVSVNGKPAGETGPMPDTATIRRDGIRGYWFERDVAFDADLMRAGTNVLQLTIPGGSVTSGIEYDYLRLELAEPDMADNH